MTPAAIRELERLIAPALMPELVAWRRRWVEELQQTNLISVAELCHAHDLGAVEAVLRRAAGAAIGKGLVEAKGVLELRAEPDADSFARRETRRLLVIRAEPKEEGRR